MTKSVFVTGVTGKQGGAVSRELLMRGYQVHTLIRDPSSKKARELVSLGVIAHDGDLEDPDALNEALTGIEAVFLVFPALPTHEVIFARNVCTAAQNCGVSHIVHSSVARTGDHETFPGWSEANHIAWYWKQKDEVERMVRTGGFEKWTILRPAFFMQNFCRPEVEFMFPGLSTTHKLQVAYYRDTRLDLVDVADIATFAANAFDDPAAYTGKIIALASQKLTASEIAECLAVVSGQPVEVEFLTDREVVVLKAKGYVALDGQVWQRDVGYNVDIESLASYGVTLASMRSALGRDGLGW